MAQDRGYIRTILGRRCYFHDPRSTYKAVSRIIQSSAADQMKLMMLRAFEYTDAIPRSNSFYPFMIPLCFSPTGLYLGEFQRVLEDNSS